MGARAPGFRNQLVAFFGLFPKQMELLKEIVPNLKRLAIITGVPGAAYSPPEARQIFRELSTIAESKLGFTTQYFRAAVANDYDEIFARLAAEHFDAVWVPATPFNLNNQTRICQLALRYRIPAISEAAEFARAGLLLTYNQDSSWSVTRAMDYVDKILRGAKPSDLPVEQATKVDLVINLKTAKALGLTVPPSLIARADEVSRMSVAGLGRVKTQGR
jgi:putative tryptophan/tyrosine transport system substrate-binding protein